MNEDISPEAQEAIVRYLTNMANGICPICEKPVTKKKQVGRCVYSVDCGHRLYQGQLPRTAGDKPPRDEMFEE